ncbi:MAG: FlgD immunoglobulin-like domain containing protein [Armatimonadota bacterium]
MFTLIGMGLLALSLGTAVLAQNQPRYVTSDVPTFGRALLKLRVETPTLMTWQTGTNPVAYRYLFQPAGRFQIATAPQAPDGGNPTRSSDENRTIASVATLYPEDEWGYQYSSKVTVAIDPDQMNGQTSTGVFQDPHALAMLRGTSTNLGNLLNFWTSAPSAGARDVGGTFQVPVNAVTTTSTHNQWVSVRQVQTVIGDAVQIEYIVTNVSSEVHNIGLRIYIDGSFGAAQADGRPIVLPDGRVITTETVLPNPAVSDDTIPDSWLSYDSTEDPNVVLRGTLNSLEVNNPGIATQAAGRPDEVAWGLARNLGANSQYFFTPNTQAPLTGEDWGYAMRWAARQLSPGESRRYVTYYGMGSSAADYEAPYAMMAYSPFSLKPRAGDDPATLDTVEQYYLTDDIGRSPFPISIYMDNFGTSPIFDASCRVRLPDGLEAIEGESLTKSAGIIQRNEIKSLNWSILATAARPGQAEIKFTGPRGKVVYREVNIPAVPVLNPLPGSTNGLEMVSIPYEFTNSDAENVFSSLTSLLPGGPSALISYDPTTSQYRWFPHPDAVTVTPGFGFWLLNRNRTPVVMPEGTSEVDNTRIYNYDIKAGWNLVGNPFTSSIRMDQIRVSGASGGEWTLDEAASRNMLLPTLYAYQPATNSYTWELTTNETSVDPYRGYWLLAREDCTLLFPPPGMYSASAGKPASQPAKPAQISLKNWKLDLRVSTPGATAVTQTLAVNSAATAGLDRFDVPEPPPSLKSDSVSLRSAFYRGESAVGMPYLVDTQAPVQGAQEWNVIVKTNASNADVTISWPSLTSLPPSLVATLVDQATGERRYMRTTNSYALRSGDSGTERLLKIIVQPRPAQALTVSSVQSAQSGQGGALLTYTLSAEAAVDVRIRNIAGAVVGEVSRGQIASAGTNTVLWNGRNTRGSFVPSGRYLCEITARSPLTGQSMSVVHPLQIKR